MFFVQQEAKTELSENALYNLQERNTNVLMLLEKKQLFVTLAPQICATLQVQ